MKWLVGRGALVGALVISFAACSSGTGTQTGEGGGQGGGHAGAFGAGGTGGAAGNLGLGGHGGAVGQSGGAGGTGGTGANAGSGAAAGSGGVIGVGGSAAGAAGGLGGAQGTGGAAGIAGTRGSAGAGGGAGTAGGAGAGGGAGAAGSTGLAGAAGSAGGAAAGATGAAGAAGVAGAAGAGGAAGAAGAGGAAGAAGVSGVGGAAGAGGAGGATITCDSVCESGELCVRGVCRGGTSRWPTLQGDVHHSGWNANETGTPPLTTAWTAALSASGGLWPAISDGTRVYITENAYFDATTRMWSLDPANGHTLWQYNFGSLFDIGQATVDRGSVYVAQCNNTPGSYMYSFVAATGSLLWSLPISAQWEHYWAPLVTPAGYLYFDGGSYGGLYGLRASDGTEMFFNSSFAQWDSWSPMFLDGQLYTYVDGVLRVDDLLTNAVLQTVTVQSPFGGTAYSMNAAPVSDGLKIYLVAPPNLVAYVPGKSTPEWTESGAYKGMPAVANNVVYTISGGQLRANDATTGNILWTFAGDSALSFPPVVAAGFVYVSSSSNAYAFDPTTQQIVWSTSPGGWLSIAGGHVYVAQANGTLIAYALTPATP